MFSIIKEKAGVVLEEPTLIIFHNEYMYSAPTLFKLIRTFLKEYKHDKHIIG